MVPLTFDAIYSKTMKQLFWTFLLGLYGTVVNVYCKVLSPHENDPVEKAEFMIHFDSQEIMKSITICFLK